MRRALPVLLVLLLTACATGPVKPPKALTTPPAWDAIPPGVVDALCQKLESHRFAGMVMVRTTQPLATPRSLAALFPMKKRPVQFPPTATRAIPVDVTGSSCAWTMIDAAQRERHYDAPVVELSAPLLNPAKPKEAGVFARVTTGSAYEWYWIALAPRDGVWVLQGVSPIDT